MDKNDPILGFFHRWLEEFAKHVEQVKVICLEKGEYNLPGIKVLSLGKEEGQSRLKYIWRFYKYLWQERKNYDTVFVHMNQEYVLLAGLWWRLASKKIWLWRNHAKGSWFTIIAVYLSQRVFCTSSQSFTARFAKTEMMPVGIDTDFFKSDSNIERVPNSILFLGRISPVKKFKEFIEALRALQQKNTNFTVTVAGSALPRDSEYNELVRRQVKEFDLDNVIKFVGAVNQAEALRLYQTHKLYVNLTPTGSMDKTIFEAMACGATPLVYNEGLRESLNNDCLVDDLLPETVAGGIERAMAQEKNFRDYVVSNHSLKSLAAKMFTNV